MRLRDKLKFVSFIVSTWKGYLRKIRGYPTNALYAEAEKLEDYKIYGIGIKSGKNLIPCPPSSLNRLNSVVNNGITYVMNSDGSITCNGTATADSVYIFYANTGGYNENILNFANIIDGEKTYWLSGCPSGGSTSTYCLTFNFTERNRKHSYWKVDVGSGVRFTTPSKLSYKWEQMSLVIRIYKGTVCNNLVFKPQLEEVSGDISTPAGTEYESYIPTPDNPKPIKTLGKKSDNLLPLRVITIGYGDATKSAQNTDRLDDIDTFHGITYNIDRDKGTIRISGTSEPDHITYIDIGYSESAYSAIYDKYYMTYNSIYEISGVPANNGVHVNVMYTITANGWKALSIDNTKKIITLDSVNGLNVGNIIVFWDYYLESNDYYTITTINTTEKTITLDKECNKIIPTYIYIKDNWQNENAPYKDLYCGWANIPNQAGPCVIFHNKYKSNYVKIFAYRIRIHANTTVDITCKPMIREIKATSKFNLISRWNNIINNTYKMFYMWETTTNKDNQNIKCYYDKSDDTINLDGSYTGASTVIYPTLWNNQIQASSDTYIFAWKKISGTVEAIDNSFVSEAKAIVGYSDGNDTTGVSINLKASDTITQILSAKNGINYSKFEVKNVKFTNFKFKLILIKQFSDYEKHDDYKIDVVHRNKNIFDVSLLSSNPLIKVRGFDVSDDKSIITIHPTKLSSNGYINTGYQLKYFCPDLQPGDNVCIYGELTQGSTNVNKFIYLNGTNKYINYSSSVPVRITEKDLEATVCFYGANTAAGDTSDDVIISNFMMIKEPLESVSYPSWRYGFSFEPYKRNVYSIKLPEPLAKVNLYEDYLDFKTKTFNKHVRKFTFPNSLNDQFYKTAVFEKWDNGAGSTKYGYTITLNNTKFFATEGNKYLTAYSDIYPCYGTKYKEDISIFWPYGSPLEGIFIRQYATTDAALKAQSTVGTAMAGTAIVYDTEYYVVIYINSNTISSLEDLKSKLAGTTLYIEADNIYKPQPIDLPDITLYEGSNIFKIDDTCAPMEVTYHPTEVY